MSKFVNVKVKTDAEGSALFQQEIDVLLEALEAANAYLYTKQGIFGTFIIDGQKYGEPAQLIVRGNFEHGRFHQGMPRGGARSSDELAEESIDEMLEWIEKGNSRYQSCSQITCEPNPVLEWVQAGNPRYQVVSDDKTKGFLAPSGIYQEEELLVLVLNATHGRFLASIMLGPQAGQKIEDEDKWLLCILAACLAQMGKEDDVLQESVACVLCKDEYHAMNAGTLVDEWFERGMLTAIEKWRSWHEPLNSIGDLPLFFE